MPEFNPVQTNEMPGKEKLCQRIWEIMRPVLCGSTPWFMRKVRLFWTRRFAGMVKGPHAYDRTCSIARNSRIDYPWRVTIGALSSIGSNAWVYALAPIEIGSRCCIGEDVRLLTGSHDVQSPNFTLVTKPIVIKDNVWIATGATILPGVTIGEGVVIAAGAVVTKDVEPWTVVGGNPAKFIKKRELKD